MKRKPMWGWLEEQGYVSGDRELLAKGKAQWKKKYHREYQRARRRQKRHVVVSLSSSDENRLNTAAIRHHRPLASYLRESSLAYTAQKFLLPDETQLVALREEIAFVRYSLQEIKRQLENSFGDEVSQQIELLIDRVDHLEDFTRTTLHNPPLLAHTN